MFKHLILRLIQIYRKYISPLKPSCCRFYPTCSEYAMEAINKYGVIKGVFFAVHRLLRCNPFCKGGYDPIE